MECLLLAERENYFRNSLVDIFSLGCLRIEISQHFYDEHSLSARRAGNIPRTFL